MPARSRRRATDTRTSSRVRNGRSDLASLAIIEAVDRRSSLIAERLRSSRRHRSEAHEREPVSEGAESTIAGLRAIAVAAGVDRTR
jgi:hypothetical protein